jgi:WD40 repeat protein/uncharacterized caspase-like protein
MMATLRKRLLIAIGLICAGAYGSFAIATSGLAQQTDRQDFQSGRFELLPSIGAISSSFALAPNEKFIGVATGTGADLWEIAGKRRIRHFVGLTSFAQTVAISPDGKWIAAANSELVVWDIATGQEAWRLNPFPHSNTRMESIAFSPDGRGIYFAGNTTTWVTGPGHPRFTYYVGGIIDTASKTTTRIVGSGTGYVVVPSSSGKIVAIGQSNATIQIVNSDGQTQRVLGENGRATNLIRAVALSPDEKLVAASFNDGRLIEIWEIASGKRIQTFEFKNEAVFTGLAWSPDGQHLAIRTDRMLQILNTTSWAIERTREFSDEAFNPTVAYSADGKTLFASIQNQLLRIDAESLNYDVINDTQGIVTLIPGRGQGNDEVLVLQTSKTTPCVILALDIAKGTFHEAYRGSTKCGYQFSSDAAGRRFAGIDDDSLFAIDLDARPDTRVLRAKLNSSKASISQDGKTVILSQGQSGNYFSVDLIDWSSGASLKRLQAHQEVSIAITTPPTSTLSPDGKLLVATGGLDGMIRQWDATSGRLLASHKYEASSLTTAPSSIVFSPDSKSFIGLQTSAMKYSFEYWAAGESKPRQTYSLAGANSIMLVGAFHPTQRKVLLGAYDGLLRIWDLSSGNVVQTLREHNEIPSQATYKSDGRRIVSSGPEDGLKIWDSESGQLLLTVFLTADGDWLKITPEGFFDASPKGAKALAVVHGLESYSIDQFYQSLYRPDLVREKLAGDPRGLVRQAAANLDLGKAIASGDAPEVRLTLPDANAAASRGAGTGVSAAAEITDRGGGIGRIEWRVNGVTVGLDNGPAGNVVQLTRNVLLDAGNNLIEVIAYNRANLIASAGARANVVVPIPTPPASTSQQPSSDQVPAPAPTASKRPRLFVVAAGVNEYADRRFVLKNAVSDATDVARAFHDAAGDLYESVQVKLVTDGEVTRDKLDAIFSDVARKVSTSDVFVLYLAGHGKTVDGHYYFVPQDFTLDGQPTESSINAAVRAEAIAQDQWQRWFSEIPARKSVILFDTCDSGTLADDETRQLEKGVANALLAQATGRSILTASGGTQEALEGYRGHGLFTYEVLDAINQADGDRSGTIELNELAAYVYAQVSELSEKVFKQRQEPQMKITANYPLTKQMSILHDEAVPVAEGRPTYQVAQAAPLQIRPGPGATVIRGLSAKSFVTVLESKDGWSLVAADGRPIGYVATRDLMPVQ